ncbi:MAG: TonB-dependent receptor [Saprospiraceae bacterium]
MKKLNLLFLVFCSCFSLSYAQSSGQIQGHAIDHENEAVLYGNVILHAAQDSSIIKLELTDENGNFTFPNIAPNRYWIELSYIGMDNYRSEIFELAANQNLTLPEIKMKNGGTDLAEVVVTAQRPLLEIKPNKMVFNVEGSINAVGSDALELLKKSPGVVVDNNDNITMLGKSGVQVYIDGKPSPLNGNDLAAYLKTLQSDQIDAIEIITNPSAKYDAQGSGGIINIRLKKDKRFGTNTSVNLGYSVGEKSKYNGGFNSNYRNNKFNIFGNYSYNQGENINITNLDRKQFGLAFQNESYGVSEWKEHGAKLGIDYSLNDQHTIGILANGNFSDSPSLDVSYTMISNDQALSLTDSTLIASNDRMTQRNNYNLNFNYAFDNGKGISWNVDADYGQYNNHGEDILLNTYSKNIEVLTNRDFYTVTPVDIKIMTFKVDTEYPLGKGVLGAGIKSSYVKTDNTFDFYDLNFPDKFRTTYVRGEIDDIKTLNEDRSNQFVYTENVNAAYANYNQQFDKLGVQVGLRVEQTNSEGELTSFKTTSNRTVKRDTIDFFPSVGLTYQVNPKHTFQLNYSRRINRPSYQDLNPFEMRLDELTFEKGNPWLRPEYSNQIQLTHSFNYMLNTSFSYSQTTNLITRVVDSDDRSNTASFISWLNLAKQHNYSLNISGGIPITKWWNSYTSLTGYQTHNIADYGSGRTIDLRVASFNVYSQHTFQLGKKLSFEASGWYNSPSVWGGTFTMEQMWSVDAGLQMRILQGRGNIKLSVSDIFKTNEWSGISRFGEVVMDASGGWDSRRFRVNFSYNFGNNNVKSRNRKTGLEAESQRIKSE